MAIGCTGKRKANVIKKKPTSRQLQADRTRTLLYSIAVSLMEKQGFTNTTVEEIAQKAGVSVGTFYHYFASKDEIFFDIFKKADEYFKATVEPALTVADEAGQPVFEQIITYFRYYAHYNLNRGFLNINQLYNTKNKFFTRKGRFMQVLLTQVFEKGFARGEFNEGLSAEEVTDYMFTVARGIVYDWCIHEGDYDLEKKTESYIRIALRGLNKPKPVQ
jgi:AcrR family transcriptional regulator